MADLSFFQIHVCESIVIERANPISLITSFNFIMGELGLSNTEWLEFDLEVNPENIPDDVEE